MQLRKSYFSFRSGFFKILITVLFFFNGSLCFAQALTDTSTGILLSTIVNKTTPEYYIKTANVVFPDILKGNETEASKYIVHFSNRRREYVIRMYKKGKNLLPKAAIILKKHNLPQELKVLMTLESAYNANAVSKAGAVGYWQIMDAVAKEYGMKYAKRGDKENVKGRLSKKGSKTNASSKSLARQKDDRKNFNKATTVAARYLKDRQRNLDDNWLLVVASYNCGVGNIWSAMEKCGMDNPKFWDVKKYLPEETQAYVMNFITLNVLFANYEKFVENKLQLRDEKVFVSKNLEQKNTAPLSETLASGLK